MRLNRPKKLMTLFATGMLLTSCICNNSNVTGDAIRSIDTKETIIKIRTAIIDGERVAIGSTYDGDIIRIEYSGNIAWQSELDPGIMNHDLACYDLDGDGTDEILAANANGAIYCLNAEGEILWQFKRNDAPMYAVTGFQKDGERYVACSGYDLNLYYLSAEGNEIEAIHASTYSKDKPYFINDGNRRPEDNLHSVNFLRTYTDKDGNDTLIVDGVNHSMNNEGGKGSLYAFKALDTTPFYYHKIDICNGPFGHMSINPFSTNLEVLFGTTKNHRDSNILAIDVENDTPRSVALTDFNSDQIPGFGYRIVMTEAISDGDNYKILSICGNNAIINSPDLDPTKAEILTTKYCYNDICYDIDNNYIILASSESGGSCIHIIDLNRDEWRDEYIALNPIGKIATILNNTEKANRELERFVAPEYEKNPRPVYMMTDSRKGLEERVEYVEKHYQSPLFFNGTGVPGGELWDRTGIVNNARYASKRDTRRKYILSQEQIVNQISSAYEGAPGIAFWGGHGNDPYMFQLETHKKVLDNANGKKTVIIYPELEEHSADFGYALDNLIYPLAAYCQETNGNIYIRTKHTFWQSIIYLPIWSRFMSGEFADVFIPSMEETTDKSMDLSVAARMGIWASGAVNSWGSRCARDNASFDRLRQHAHQNLPNHFLRMMVYHLSMGAQYLDNATVDAKYTSIIWDMIGKGLIYIPTRDEIVSFSPVHISMIEPDEEWINQTNNNKWTTFYTQEFEDNNHFVFGRINGTWPGAKVTDWDFSRYAAGVDDRRLNFLPPYNNGLVLITPPQEGKYADLDAPRAEMKDILNPIYKDILKEYYTDGRNYYSADGKESYPADSYYKVIEQEIKERSKLLPITIEGDVAWVASQSAPKHIRLTLIDGGYINPSDKDVTITFNTLQPIKVIDLLLGKEIEVNRSTSSVTVPCGTFLFLDVELSKELL